MKLQDLKIGMVFRVNHLCSDNDVEIISIKDGRVYLREKSLHRCSGGKRDETGHVVYDKKIEDFLKATTEIEYYRYIPTDRWDK